VNNILARRAGERWKWLLKAMSVVEEETTNRKVKQEIDKELAEIRARMEQLTLKMQQEAKVHWRYEWPLNKKAKWPVQKLLARKQQQELRKWLRYAESLSDTELVCICEPEVGETLSDEEEGSVSDLINCQEGRDEFSYCQVGNEMRSLEDLIDCQEDNNGNSYCQEGNDMRLAEDLINCQVGRSELSSCQVGNGKRSTEGLTYCQGGSGESLDCQVGNEMGSLDLIDCQVGNRKFPNCQVGRGKELRLSESLRDSGVSSGQQGVLISEDSCGFADHVNEDDDKLKTCTIQEEDQKSILMIGGIRVFLPDSPIEARACVADATTEGGQPTETVKEEEEMEQTLMFYPRRRRRAFNRIAQNFQPGS
jgi:hypothetical protein